jgi:NAD(P)-dependent dehydrogenase (short-subunit alcohol dehydrogenase family)
MRLVVAELDEQAGAKVTATLVAQGSEAYFVRTDVADLASVEALSVAASNLLGDVELLINNAGVAMIGEIATMPIAEWHQIIDVNLWGVVHGVRTFLPAMLAGSGWRHICNVGSMAAMRAIPASAAYCVSKSAVHALSDVLRLEVAEQGIGVSVVAPGAIATSILDGRDKGDVARRTRGTAGASLAARKEPEEVATTILDGIVAGQFYIATHPDNRDQVTQRLEEIRTAFGV